MRVNQTPPHITLNAKEYTQIYDSLQILYGVSKILSEIAVNSAPRMSSLAEVLDSLAPYYKKVENSIAELHHFIPYDEYCRYNAINQETGEVLMGKSEAELDLLKIMNQIEMRQTCRYDKYDTPIKESR